MSLYLGGIASAPDENGTLRRMPASRFLPSDYLAAALPLGFQVRACHEPLWPSSPTVRQRAAAATDATYENTPAAIIWHIYLS